MTEAGLHPDELFFTPWPRANRYIALAHSRNYGLPAFPRAFFCLFFAALPFIFEPFVQIGMSDGDGKGSTFIVPLPLAV